MNALHHPVVALHGVHKTYRLGQHVVPALQGVDLIVQRGELLALTGPSGSGKSTLLNLCGLIDTPDSGEIALSGQPVGKLNENQRTLLRRDALGFVFQSFNLVPVMTVAENVDYPLFLVGVPLAERRERVAAQLAAVGLILVGGEAVVAGRGRLVGGHLEGQRVGRDGSVHAAIGRAAIVLHAEGEGGRARCCAHRTRPRP